MLKSLHQSGSAVEPPIRGFGQLPNRYPIPSPVTSEHGLGMEVLPTVLKLGYRSLPPE
jgi:hypothetical protein